MASLTLGFVKNYLGYSTKGMRDVSIGAGLVARVTQLLDARGREPRRPERYEIVIPVGKDEVELDVGEGYYGIEVVLPSGALLTRQADLRHAERQEIRFDDQHSPHEWLSWQHLEGAVPGGRDYYAAGPNQNLPMSPRGVAAYAPRPAPQASVFRRSIAVQDPFANAWPEIRPQISPDGFSRITLFRRHLPGHYAHGLVEQLSWAWLIGSLEARIPDWVKGGWLEPAPEQLVRFGSDHALDCWRSSGFRDDMLYFALVQTPRSVELVRLPFPWPDTRNDDDLLEITVDKTDLRRPSRTNVSLLDPAFFGLLSYLKSGSFAAGRTMIEKGIRDESVLDLLYEKNQNPMAAAGAALCLLASTNASREKNWHQWIANLDEWFGWLPDGAVAHGRLLLASGKSKQKLAREAFLRAFERGLPFYTLGLSWLLEGLSRFDDPHCQEAADVVRRAAVRSDVSQAFTVLRVGPFGGGY